MEINKPAVSITSVGQNGRVSKHQKRTILCLLGALLLFGLLLSRGSRVLAQRVAQARESQLQQSPQAVAEAGAPLRRPCNAFRLAECDVN